MDFFSVRGTFRRGADKKWNDPFSQPTNCNGLLFKPVISGVKDSSVAWIGMIDETSANLYDKWNSGYNTPITYWRSGKGLCMKFNV